MAYYPNGSLADANIVNEERLISSFGQIIDCLSYLHPKGIVHRDLKPENFLVELKPFYKVVLADFGMANIATDDAWLGTFCGTYKYAAPEVFPFSTGGYGPKVDIWSLAVIALEWLHGIPMPEAVPTPRRQGLSVPADKWSVWVNDWVARLLTHLDDQEPGQMFDILYCMLDTEDAKRPDASACLRLGFRNGLFIRRPIDGLVVYSGDLEDIDPSTEQQSEGTKTPNKTLSPR
ncbi:hypothetical protein MMC19_001575 [Ptychographa xylographoides]|nr:hypothetical protein [Ptychographa xylographoides]